MVVEEQEFVESKASENTNSSDNSKPGEIYKDDNGFMNIPDNLEDDELPF